MWQADGRVIATRDESYSASRAEPVKVARFRLTRRVLRCWAKDPLFDGWLSHGMRVAESAQAEDVYRGAAPAWRKMIHAGVVGFAVEVVNRSGDQR